MRVGLEQRDLHAGLRHDPRVSVTDAEGVVTGDVAQRLDQDGDARSRDRRRDLPAFGRAGQNELELELRREPQGGLDVAPPVGIGDERHPSVEHGEQGVQVPRRRRQRLHLRAAEIGLAPLVLERVAEHAAQPFRHGGPRAPGGVFGALREIGDHAHRRFHEHLLDRGAVEINQDRLAAHEVAGRHGERGRDPFDSRDGDDRRGRVDPFRHVEGRGDGVALHARVARPRHRADLHQAELAGPVDEARGDPFPGGVDAGRIRRNGHVPSHGDDAAVADQYAGVGELRTGDGIDRSTRDGNGLGEQQRDHRSLPGAGISPSSKSVRGWCAASERSYASQPSL